MLVLSVVFWHNSPVHTSYKWSSGVSLILGTERIFTGYSTPRTYTGPKGGHPVLHISTVYRDSKFESRLRGSLWLGIGSKTLLQTFMQREYVPSQYDDVRCPMNVLLLL